MYEAAERARLGDISYFEGLPTAELQALVVGRDEDGRTLLHTAAASGRTDLVDLLANSGAAKVVNKQDDEGWSPLHSAVSAGHEAVVCSLMSMGANPDITNSGGQTPLHYAASKGNLALLRLLIKYGAKVNAKDQTGSTALHRACSSGKQEAVRVLVEEGCAKIDAKDKQHATPLFVAVACGNTSIAYYLAARGADLEAHTKQGETPMSIAMGDVAASLRAAAKQGMDVDE